MSSLERLIIQNINHNKLKESIYPSCEGETDLDRQCNDLIELYNMMLDKGYDTLPENTNEKKSYREIEAKLIELNVEGVKKSPIINSKGMPGEFLTTQEKSIMPESKRIKESAYKLLKGKRFSSIKQIETFLDKNGYDLINYNNYQLEILDQGESDNKVETVPFTRVGPNTYEI